MATVKHTVAKGETLSSIASKYKTTVDNLVKLNNIKDPNRIYIGQVLYISGKPSGSSSSSSSSGSTSAPRTATIIHAGIQANTQNTAYACWTWSRDNTEKYIYEWDYTTNGEIWFMGTHSEVSADTTTTKDSVYTVPENAVLVRFRVKPISKTKKVNDKEVEYWKADWTGFKIIDPEVASAPPQPRVPTVTVEKYKLTARLDGLEDNISQVAFNLLTDADVMVNSSTITIEPTLRSAEAQFNIIAGRRYKVRARVKRNAYWSPWSDDTEYVYAAPSAPIIATCQAASKTSVSLSWSAVDTAESYSIEYSTKKEWLEGSNATTVINDIKVTRYEVTGLESGNTYYFRVSSKNKTGESEWSSIESAILGTKPEAPTTWSTTTTAIVGEDIILYWVQNSEDKSRERKAELELDINGDITTHTIEKEVNEDEKEVTSQYIVKTDELSEGAVIKWRVRTAGVTLEYGEWSIQRTINVFAPPVINTRLIDRTSNDLTILDSFPFYIESTFGPATQKPLTYHISIISNGSYTTIDEVGNVQNVVEGDEIMSKFYDPNIGRIEISPADVDLNTGIRYSVITTVAMDSGLTAEDTNDFEVSWVDDIYNPNAEIAINRDTISCSINPYCNYYPDIYYKAEYNDVDNTWSATEMVLPVIEGISVDNAFTENGDIVYAGMYNGELTHYCVIQSREPVLVEDVYLAIYRKETDGRYVLIADEIKNDGSVFILDPHPALDYARYRIIARSYRTGSISYTDLPPIPISEPGIVLQWNEYINTFDPTEDVIQQPDWSGSMLRLKYNVDISDSNDMDVVFVEYIGRADPVSYYGTQVGTKSKWTTDIPADDTETLSALRRLSRWFGDVYVRESSGTGYWANVDVTFTKTHREVIIPVTLSITKVDGGV